MTPEPAMRQGGASGATIPPRPARAPLARPRRTRLVVTRGSFHLADELFEDGAEADLARAWATMMPEGAKPARRQRVAGGIRQHWRRVRIVELPA
jgi:hypothetical protein